jgi:hypothetical protein
MASRVRREIGVAEGLVGRFVDQIVCRVPTAVLEAADVVDRLSKVRARGTFHLPLPLG